MSGCGSYHNYTVVESFFTKFKREWIRRQPHKALAKHRQDGSDCIEML
jgi:hypothetical protein